MATKLPRTQVAFACLIDATHFYTVCSLFSDASAFETVGTQVFRSEGDPETGKSVLKTYPRASRSFCMVFNSYSGQLLLARGFCLGGLVSLLLQWEASEVLLWEPGFALSGFKSPLPGRGR